MAPIVAAGFAILTGPVFAGAQGDPEESCDGSTAEMVACANAKIAQWDKRLNAAYAKALKLAQPKQREQLRVAQRLWLQYRSANCLYFDMGEGTIARIDAADCMLRLTQYRAEELEAVDIDGNPGKEDRN
ncbi:MAG: lysozyme inhibitor LprI family protein [Pseudolabrys sp.]